MKNLCVVAIAAIAACAGCQASVSAGSVPLASDGKTDYVIVLSSKASVSEQFAAKELADHIKQMTGATLAVKTADADLPAKAIVLGDSPAVAGLGVKVDLASLGTDGYVIKTVGDRLVIAGGATRGTLYGVYTLLESLGVRWWYPGETDIPTVTTIAVPETDLREVPKLEYRDMMFNENYSGWLWNARNKVNGHAWDDAPEKVGGRYKFVGNLVHSYTLLLKKSGHEITEDMKALVKGKRTFAQPCLSSEKTLAAMVDGVLKAFEEMPDAEFVVVGQMDNHNYCTCPECAAIDKAEDRNEGKPFRQGSKMGTSHTGQVIRFANRVAEAVEKRRPGSCIVTAAYEWSRKPPKNLKPRDNVFISLCSIECDFAHPLDDPSIAVNKAFKDDIAIWSKIARKVFIWHYVGNRDHYLMPNAELTTLVPNMKFFVDHGAAGIFNQGTHRGKATDMTMMKQWLLAKSMWHPEADSRKLIEEFCHGFYGPAGADVLRYVDLIHGVAKTETFHNGRRVHLNAPYLKPEIVAQAEEILRAADAKVAGNEVYARRVRHAHMGIWYVLAKRGPLSNAWKATEAKVGKIDPVALADSLARVVNEWKINCICDPVEIGGWITWVKHYMAIVKKTGKAPIPPELEGKAPATYTLVQACQLDMTPKWWAPAEGASDGYAAHVPSAGWHTHYRPMAWEGVEPGKTYKVFVRAKGDLKSEAEDDVTVWEFGVYPKGKTVRVTAGELKGDGFHVFDLGPLKFTKDHFWWTALKPNPKGANSVIIDCIWFVEVPTD